MTQTVIRRGDRKGAQAALRTKPRNKYGAKKVRLDGYVFDSKLEASRYAVLLRRLRAGEIRTLEVHPKFPIHIRGILSSDYIAVGEYIADFSYRDMAAEKMVIEDAKGVRTALYQFKKRCVEAQYGIKIVEIGKRKRSRKKAAAPHLPPPTCRRNYTRGPI